MDISSLPRSGAWTTSGAIEYGIACTDSQDVAHVAAQTIAVIGADAVARKGSFTFAVSGGRTPWLMFEELASMEFPWPETTIFQVDERIAADDDDARNLGHLLQSLGTAQVSVVPMPVTSHDLADAARRYGSSLPSSIDLIHLGLGTDGHTASLVPGDPILDVVDQPVAITENAYQGYRRMSVTYPTLNKAAAVLWVVTGAEKAPALRRLMDADPTIPAGRVHAAEMLLVADRAALA